MDKGVEKGSAAEGISAALQAAFIWTPAVPTGEQAYVAYRRGVDLAEKPMEATLHLFADSRYVLWINGEYVERGPCRFDPQRPEYDTLEVAAHLRQGTNLLAVLVHHCHDGLATGDPTPMNGRTMRHCPGMTLRLELTWADGRALIIQTDSTWRAIRHAGYKSVPPSWGGIPDDLDARLGPIGWTVPEFDDATWDRAEPVDGGQWGMLHPRTLPLLRETEVIPATVLRQSRQSGDGPRPLTEVLPLVLTGGEELLIDIGRTVLAYDLLDLEATDGAVVEILHGHGCVDGQLDEVHLVNRYLARSGRQEYRGGDVIGCHYLLIRVPSGRITLHGIRMVERIYPFERLGSFHSDDPFLEALWARGLNTVELCSEDGYTDCSGRERTEWMGDAAICEYPVTRVALAGRGSDGRPIYGDPRLLASMLRHVGLSQQPDGRLKAHHPSDRWDIHGYIEDYSCLWVQMLRAYWENTGDAALPRELWPHLVAQLRWFLDRRTDRGLVEAREFVFFDNPLSYRVCEGTTLNASVAGALGHAAFLAEILGFRGAAAEYAEAADQLVQALNRHLWDADAGTYLGGLGEGIPSEATIHAAMLALYHGVVPASRRESVLRYVAANMDRIGSPYSAHFLFEVIYREGTPELDRAALRLMREKWAPVLARQDHDTVTEGFGPASLCHNIGAVPVYYLSAWVLGVRREGELAARTVVIEPHLGDLHRASGTVVTELGPVSVAWQRGVKDGQLEFDCELPAGVSASLCLPVVGEGARMVIDGEAIPADYLTGRGGRARVSLGAGNHSGKVERP